MISELLKEILLFVLERVEGKIERLSFFIGHAVSSRIAHFFQPFHRERLSFLGARDKCLSLDSDLVMVNSFDENKFIYDFANRDQVDVWLGISENVILYVI